MKIKNSKRFALQRAKRMNEMVAAKKRKSLEPVDLNVLTQSKCSNECGLANAQIKPEKNQEMMDDVPSNPASSYTENPDQDRHDQAEVDVIMTEAEAADDHMSDSVLCHELNITDEHEKEIKGKHCGRRIVSVGYFFGKIQEISKHGPICSVNDLVLVGEKIKGLTSKFTFLCRMCNMKFYIDNDNCEDNYLDMNSCVVAGTIAIGCGQSQLVELLSSVNLPIIDEKLYDDRHSLLSKHWKSVSLETMKQAAAEERAFALAKGRVNKDGIPIIDVVADGCWSKRSYKKNYSALSGAATIIGKNTGKILFIGVKNKYCQMCAKTEKEKNEPKEHLCFKNYDGPSTGMENQIIVEGFKTSIEMHNLIYGRLISDGDSSTYAKILEARPYMSPDVTVEKVECRNHVLRNFCNKLVALSSDTKYPIRFRKIISKNRVLSIRAAICKIIKKHKDGSDIQHLFEDLLSSHLHGFGNHKKCQSYFCDKVGVEEDLPQEFFLSSLWQRVCFITQSVAAHARSLKHDVDSNVVENFHSIIAKFVGGKHFSKKNSYSARCYAAAVAFNTKKCISRLYKSLNKGKSPSGKIKKLEESRILNLLRNKNSKKPRRRINFGRTQKTDKHYGEKCVKEDLDKETFEKLKINFLESLKKTDEERVSIEKATILQSDSSEWLELRRSKLTASNFGKIIKRKPETSCAKTVKELCYKTNSLDHVLSVKHGRENEKRALQQLEQQENIKIAPCGLFIDKELPYLGATPDGLCGEDTIVEVKCPISAHNLGLEEAIKAKKLTFWKLNQNGLLTVNQSHNWFYQVQGQLHITQRLKCLFAVWHSDKAPLKTEIILKNNNFWSQQMEPKLTKFYINCILPELIDPRHPRNLPIKDPDYILNAIIKKKELVKINKTKKNVS